MILKANLSTIVGLLPIDAKQFTIIAHEMMNEGLMLAIQPERGAESGNNANADYKIFIMLSQPQHSLLQMSSSTQFCTKN